MDGILLTSSIVSHFDPCNPYSKSVSIRFSGVLTLSLCTGSIKDSPNSISSCSWSTKICSSSLALIDDVSLSRVSVVSPVDEL